MINVLQFMKRYKYYLIVGFGVVLSCMTVMVLMGLLSGPRIMWYSQYLRENGYPENQVSVYVAREKQDQCEVHNVPLESDVVGPSYGYPSKAYRQAVSTFPNAYTSIHLGCNRSDSAPNFRVRYCPVCRDRKAQWLSQQQEQNKQAMEE